MRRRKLVPLFVAAAALIAAGCENFHFNVTKQVVPEGASQGPFTVHISCVPLPDSFEGGGTQTPPADTTTDTTPEATGVAAYGPPPQEEDISFNGPGKTLSLTDFDEESTCTITEPVTAGALSVTIACGAITPPAPPAAVTCTPIANGLTVVVGELDEDSTIDILVTNRFPDPIVVAPTFTG
jgi:hypothetical protein